MADLTSIYSDLNLLTCGIILQRIINQSYGIHYDYFFTLRYPYWVETRFGLTLPVPRTGRITNGSDDNGWCEGGSEIFTGIDKSLLNCTGLRSSEHLTDMSFGRMRQFAMKKSFNALCLEPHLPRTHGALDGNRSFRNKVGVKNF